MSTDPYDNGGWRPHGPAKLTIRQEEMLIPLNLDEDGTPMYHGERLVEVEPGKWMHPDAILLQKVLEDAARSL